MNITGQTGRFSMNTTGKVPPLSTSRKPVLAAMRRLYNMSQNYDELVHNRSTNNKYGNIEVIKNRRKSKKRDTQKQIMIKGTNYI